MEELVVFALMFVCCDCVGFKDASAVGVGVDAGPGFLEWPFSVPTIFYGCHQVDLGSWVEG